MVNHPEEYQDVLTDFAKLALHENTIFDDFNFEEQITMAKERELVKP